MAPLESLLEMPPPHFVTGSFESQEARIRFAARCVHLDKISLTKKASYKDMYRTLARIQSHSILPKTQLVLELAHLTYFIHLTSIPCSFGVRTIWSSTWTDVSLLADFALFYVSRRSLAMVWNMVLYVWLLSPTRPWQRPSCRPPGQSPRFP